MRKVAVLLAAGSLVISAAVPAAASIDFGGTIKSEMTLSPDETTNKWQLKGATGLDIEAKLKAEGGYDLKGVVEFKPWGFDNYDADDPDMELPDMAADYPTWPTVNAPVKRADGSPTGDTVDVPQSALTIDKVYLQSTGPYWDGGPWLTTTIGDAEAHWDDWVSWIDNRGLMLEGAQVGPVSARGFYFVRGTDRPAGMQVSGQLQGVDLSATAVSSNGKNDFAFHGGVSPLPMLNLKGDLAVDADAEQAYKLTATAEPIQSVKLTASYRANDGFSPMFAHAEDDVDHDRNPLTDEVTAPVAFDDKTGFTVGAETTQLGIHVAAEYDNPTDVGRLAADTKVLNGVTVKGEAWAQAEAQQWLQAKLSAETDPGFIGVPRTALNGSVTMKNDASLGEPAWAVGAKYAAPNGVDLGAEYDSEKGPAVTAGMQVSF